MTTNVNRYKVTPDYVKVLRIRGTNGETSEELASMLAEGKILVSGNAENDILWRRRFQTSSERNLKIPVKTLFCQ